VPGHPTSFAFHSIPHHIMSVIDHFARGVDFITEIRAPLDTNGGRPPDGSFEKGISKIRELWSNPAVQLSDLVCQLAVKGSRAEDVYLSSLRSSMR
jgi:hypothetical protein